MKFCLEERLVHDFPDVRIGFLLANVTVEEQHPHVESLKNSLLSSLVEKGLTRSNYANQPAIASWRSVYQNCFGVKPKTYRSSVESLVLRLLKGKPMWQISSVVDLYNCCSVLSLLPMGAYDYEQINGDIWLRYGVRGESFRAINETTSVMVEPNHIVYADESEVLCWLWNYRDCDKTAITKKTRKALFIIDSVAIQSGAVEEALQLLSSHLLHLGNEVLKQGILSADNPIVQLGIT